MSDAVKRFSDFNGVSLAKIKDADYFAIPGRFHASDAGKLLASPAFYRYCADNPKPTSATMLPGKIMHAALGDWDELQKYVTEVPGLAGLCDDKGKPYVSPAASNKGKAIIENWQACNPDSTLVKPEVFDRAMTMAELLTERETSLGLVNAIHRETAILWTGDNDVPCILKIDALFEFADRLVLVDYKKHGKLLSNHSLATSVSDYGYHRAAAHYLDGVAAAQAAGLLPNKPCEFHLGWVSEVPPHETHFQVVPDSLLQIGAAELAIAKVRWVECNESGKWPESGDIGGLSATASLPGYKLRDAAIIADNNVDYTAALAELEGM